MPAISGHNTQWFFEADPTGAQAVFTLIGEQRGDLNFSESRNTFDASSHSSTIDSMIVSALRRRGPATFQIQLDKDDTTHTTLETHYNNNVKFAMNYRGPDYVVSATSDVMGSGQLIKFERVGPEDAGAYVANLEFVFSGTMIKNGVTIPA